MGRSALYLALLRRFAVSQGDAIRRTRDALDGGDAPLAKRIVHTLKGVAGSIGATDLAGATTALESCLQAPEPQSETQAAMTQQAMSVAARHLDGLVHALHEKLSALPASGAAPAAMADALVTVCKRLARLLKEQDFEAEEVFDQHQALLKAALGADFAELKTALDAFKFDQALIALNQALLARQVRI